MRKKLLTILLIAGLIVPVNISGILSRVQAAGARSASEASYKVMRSIGWR